MSWALWIGSFLLSFVVYQALRPQREIPGAVRRERPGYKPVWTGIFQRVWIPDPSKDLDDANPYKVK